MSNQKTEIHPADAKKVNDLLSDMMETITDYKEYFDGDHSIEALKAMKAKLDSDWKYIEYYF